MKSVLRIGLMLIPVLITLIASDCKKEHWLRVYNNGVFEHKIDITGWEVNEDLVKLGGFYYPWQGEDSIDYRGCYFCEGKKYVEDYAVRYLLEVNGVVVGLYLYDVMLHQVPDHSKILTVVYTGTADSFIRKYGAGVLRAFPNLVGVHISIDSLTEFHRLDSIPSYLRLYVECSCVSNEAFELLSRHLNIRALEIRGDWNKISYDGVRHLWDLKDLRFIASLYPIPFVGFDSTNFPKLREIDSSPIPLL